MQMERFQLSKVNVAMVTGNTQATEKARRYANNLFVDEATQKIFYCYLSNAQVPEYFHKESWKYWQSAVNRWNGHIEGNLLPWFCVIVYKYLTETISSYYGDGEKRVTAYDLCAVAEIDFMRFLSDLKHFELMVDGEQSAETVELTKKFQFSFAIAHEHRQLCDYVFNADGLNHNASKLPWQLFLIARLSNVGSPSSIMEYYNVYVCCLAYSLTLTHFRLLQEPFTTICNVTCDVEATIFEALCYHLELPHVKFTSVYRCDWIPFRVFLQQICHHSRNDLTHYVQSKYEFYLDTQLDFDENLLLNEDDDILNSHVRGEASDKSLTFKTLVKTSVRELMEIARVEDPKSLQPFIDNASKLTRKKFQTKITELQSCFMEHIGHRIDVSYGISGRLCQAFVQLYLIKLKSILKAEECRLQEKDLSSILCCEKFNKGLFAICVDIVLQCEERVPYFIKSGNCSLLHVAQIYGVSAFGVHALLEKFILHEPHLPEEVTKYLMLCESSLLINYIWKENDVYDHINIPQPDNIFNMNSENFSEMVCGKSVSLKYFISRVRKVVQSRLLLLIDALGFAEDEAEEQFQCTWPCVQYVILYKYELTKNRHLDQLMLCCIYSMAKVLDKEVKFRSIVNAYNLLRLGSSEVYTCVRMQNDAESCIITFYNEIFIHAMKDFVVLFGLHRKNYKMSALNSHEFSIQKLRKVHKQHIHWLDL